MLQNLAFYLDLWSVQTNEASGRVCADYPVKESVQFQSTVDYSPTAKLSMLPNCRTTPLKTVSLKTRASCVTEWTSVKRLWMFRDFDGVQTWPWNGWNGPCSSLSRTPKHSTHTKTHTRLGQKKNSWIHVWIFRKEECVLSPPLAAVQVLIWNRARRHHFERRRRVRNVTHTDTLTAYLLVKLKNVSRFKISEFSKN